MFKINSLFVLNWSEKKNQLIRYKTNAIKRQQPSKKIKIDLNFLLV